MELSTPTKKLHQLSGRLNLYTSHYCQKNKPDIIRLRAEINSIKQIISDIEIKIDSI